MGISMVSRHSFNIYVMCQMNIGCIDILLTQTFPLRQLICYASQVTRQCDSYYNNFR